MTQTKQSDYLSTNYTVAFAALKGGNVEFSEFMALINKVYEYGFSRGVLHGIEKCQEEINKGKSK